MNKPKSPVVENPWGQLRRFTAARIALGRTGVSLPTDPQLAFQLAHARARDAVHLALDAPQLVRAFESAGLPGVANGLILDSAAGDRLTYVQRPDLGRRLNQASRATLAALPEADEVGGGIDWIDIVNAVAGIAPRRSAGSTEPLAPR